MPAIWQVSDLRHELLHRAALRLRLDQREHLVLELGVLAAAGFHECSALRGGPVDGLVKDAAYV